MTTRAGVPAPTAIEYPDSDGEPMAEITLQFRWIVTIKEGLEAALAADPAVFVAGDLLWYPVEGDPKTRMAPDAMIAFGRPKGYRGSYKQWEEGGVAPKVVFEVLSPGNRAGGSERKFQFYGRFGVEEYYQYDPDDGRLLGWLRDGGALRPIAEMGGWVSPRLGIRFNTSGEVLRLFRPDGRPFLTFVETDQAMEDARRRADEAARRVEAERLKADEAAWKVEQVARQAEQAIRQAEQATRQAEEERLRAVRLRALGIDPDGA